MSPDLDESIDIRLERCPRCGELTPVRLEEGEQPLVFVRWSLRKSDSCDHMVVDAFSVANWPSGDAGETPSDQLEEPPSD